MVNRTIHFSVVKNPQGGLKNWFVIDNVNWAGLHPNNTPSSMVHDIVEHINGIDALGPINEEMEALGSKLFINKENNSEKRLAIYVAEAMAMTWNAYHKTAEFRLSAEEYVSCGESMDGVIDDVISMVKEGYVDDETNVCFFKQNTMNDLVSQEFKVRLSAGYRKSAALYKDVSNARKIADRVSVLMESIWHIKGKYKLIMNDEPHVVFVD